MKIRQGFISNSSSASFCIYGWTSDQLKLSYMESLEFCNKLREKHPKIFYFWHPTSEFIIGVGNTNEDMDHDMCDWEDYTCHSPDPEEMKLLDQVAEEMGLPKPTMESATWYN